MKSELEMTREAIEIVSAAGHQVKFTQLAYHNLMEESIAFLRSRGFKVEENQFSSDKINAAIHQKQILARIVYDAPKNESGIRIHNAPSPSEIAETQAEIEDGFGDPEK